jgi:hypothetical protein
MIKSWPIIEWKLPRETPLWPSLVHANTTVREGLGEHTARRCGETVWIGVVGGQSIGAAWEWVELRPGVVMISDPNSIVTNVRFLDELDAPQAYLPSVVSVNRLAHALDWQPTVAALVASSRAQPEFEVLHTLDGAHHWPAAERFRSRAA